MNITVTSEQGILFLTNESEELKKAGINEERIRVLDLIDTCQRRSAKLNKSEILSELESLRIEVWRGDQRLATE